MDHHSKTRDEMLALPIGQIVDGWVLDDGRLYLFVQVPDSNVTTTITLDRGRSKR